MIDLTDDGIRNYISTKKCPQNPEEIIWLVKHFKALNPKNAIEIGVERGYPTMLWRDLLSKEGKLIGIDINFHLLRANFLNKADYNKIYLLEGFSNSPCIIDSVTRILNGEKIDFIFIDGDHEYESVKSDYENYKKFLRPGGKIALHDVMCCRGIDGTFNTFDENGHLHGGPTRLYLEITNIKERNGNTAIITL